MYRLLLDQNFPKPPGFSMSAIDATVEVAHVSEFDARLTKADTPDWFIYLRAARAGFDGFVTRDRSQIEQEEELWVLTRLNLHLITFRRPIEDPIVEWGQLLAYLPLIRKRFSASKSLVILLPRPDLTSRNVIEPKELLHTLANELGISANQLRREAKSSVASYLQALPGGEAEYGSI